MLDCYEVIVCSFYSILFFFETYFILVIESDHIIKGVRFIN